MSNGIRIGQISAVVFGSRVLQALIGFLATVYFARVLGAEIWGFYALVVAVYTWLRFGGRVGIAGAITKRISEGEDQAEFFTAGLIVVFWFGLVVSVTVLVLRDLVNSYVGAPVAELIVVLTLTGLLFSFVTAALQGKRLVHVSELLKPGNTVVRIVIQLGLVTIGLGLTGLIIGKIAGLLMGAIAGMFFLSVGLGRPKIEHFRSLFNYAKYAWLGRLSGRTFENADIVVLGAFVPATLVGVYSVAWSIATFLMLFAGSISSTLFPEISRASTEHDAERISTFVTDSLAYGGLIVIPGLFGALVIDDRLLLIYSGEFVQGTEVLTILILATLVYSYHKQLLNALNAIDRPDVTFRINAVFLVANVVLNVILILWIGWVGAAVATALSASLGVILSFRAARMLITFEVPVGELARQLSAATFMMVIVYSTRDLIEATGIVQRNIIVVLILVGLGAGVYFGVLLAISERFRTTVATNSPVPIPLLTR